MITSTRILRQDLNKYRNPDTKIERMVQHGDLVPIKRGWFETNQAVEPHLLAGVLCRPSYLSFDYALEYYGLIPEHVFTITSATFKKKKKKVYQNAFGRFSFQDVPAVIYPWGILGHRDGSYYYQIATPEKALCDKLYTISPPVRNQRELYELLTENLRIEETGLRNLSFSDLQFFSNYYPCKNVKLLYPTLKRYLP